MLRICDFFFMLQKTKCRNVSRWEKVLMTLATALPWQPRSMSPSSLADESISIRITHVDDNRLGMLSGAFFRLTLIGLWIFWYQNNTKDVETPKVIPNAFQQSDTWFWDSDFRKPSSLQPSGGSHTNIQKSALDATEICCKLKVPRAQVLSASTAMFIEVLQKAHKK